MKHVRAQIREHAADLLRGQWPWEEHVYTSRTAPLEQGVDRGVRVMIQQEESVPQGQGTNPLQERTAQLEIHLHARGVDFDDAIDEMALIAEKQLVEHYDMGGLVKALNYAGMTSDYSEEQPEAAVILTFEVTYLTREQNPETAL